MARPKKDATATVTTATVHSAPGLNLRKNPALNAPILRILRDGEEIAIDNSVDAPGGWLAVVGGGYVMAEYTR